MNKYIIILIYAGLAVATFIAFEPVRHNEFVDYDDLDYVVENPHVNQGIKLKSVYWLFTHAYAGNWHPVTWISHMSDCQLFGLKAFWHHATNLLFHVINALLLFWFLRKSTGSIWASAFTAAIFAVHPLRVESVAWVAERKDVLSGFFWLLTIIAYAGYCRRGGIVRYLTVFLTFCLGVMSKPMVVTLPLVLLLLDFWPLGRFRFQKVAEGSDGTTNSGVSVVRLIVEKVPLFFAMAVLSAITFFAQRGSGTMTSMGGLSVKLRVANAAVSYFRYIGKMFYPSRLAILYPHPAYKVGLFGPIVSAMVLAVVTVGILYAVWRRRRLGWLGTGWLWYVITLVPVIGLVQVGAQAIADRYTYLPSIGIAIMLAWGAAELCGKRRLGKIVLTISGVSVVIVLMMCTRTQTGYWQNSARLYGHTLEVTEDNYIIESFYGGVLFKQAQLTEAETHLKEALRINAEYLHAHWIMSRVLSRSGEVDGAVGHLKEVLKLNPNLPEAHNELGILYTNWGRYESAVRSFEEALRLKPNDPAITGNLEAVQMKLFQKNRYSK